MVEFSEITRSFTVLLGFLEPKTIDYILVFLEALALSQKSPHQTRLLLYVASFCSSLFVNAITDDRAHTVSLPLLGDLQNHTYFLGCLKPIFLVNRFPQA